MKGRTSERARGALAGVTAMVAIEVDHFDTCFVDYLLDHQDVVGISLGYTSEEDAAEALFDEVMSCTELPASMTDEELRSVCGEAVRGLDLRPIDRNGERVDDAEAASDEQPCAWFRVTSSP
jgi:hypothetical protein